MEAILALLKADEVKTFPSIFMPPPMKSESPKLHTTTPSGSKSNKYRSFKAKSKISLPPISDELPSSAPGKNLTGSLNGHKTTILEADSRHKMLDDKNIFTGFNTANVLLGGSEEEGYPDRQAKPDQQNQTNSQAIIDISLPEKMTATTSTNHMKFHKSNNKRKPVLTNKFKNIKSKYSQSKLPDHSSSQIATDSVELELGSQTLGPTPDNSAVPSLTTLHERAGLIKSIKTVRKNDSVMNELRNYMLLMDQYSLHNFIIYDGKTLRDTPEFSAMKASYEHSWGAMNYIIGLLEDFVAKYKVKMAIIDSEKLHQLSRLDLPKYEKSDLLSCIANSQQLKPQFSAALTEAGIEGLTECVIKIQALARRYLAKKKFLQLRLRWLSIIKIQAHYRRRRYRLMMLSMIKSNRAHIDDKWIETKFKLQIWWKATPDYIGGKVDLSRVNSQATVSSQSGSVATRKTSVSGRSSSIKMGSYSGTTSRRVSIDLKDVPVTKVVDEPGDDDLASQSSSIHANTYNGIAITQPIMPAPGSLNILSAMAPMTPSRKRLLIYIPSIASPEYIRLHTNQLQAHENVNISCLHYLQDPDVHLVYVSPLKLTLADISEHEKYLNILGINNVLTRLHFVVPELLERLPKQLSLAQVLLCSRDALHKLKCLIQRFQNTILIPTNISWVEKRLVDTLNVPMLSTEPSQAVVLESRSVIKKLFMSVGMNIPLGAHDIFCEDDLIIALSRLISTNLDIKRWILRLNYDQNQESVVYLDVDKLSVVSSLRKEQQKILAESKTSLLAWYSRPVQFSIRQRLITSLKLELPKRITICTPGLYPTWASYLQYLAMYGVTIEAEAIEKIGYVDSLCFIQPSGQVKYVCGYDVIVDAYRYQSQGIVMPQTMAPPQALEGASLAVCDALHKKHDVVGYVTIKFESSWDGLTNIPKLVALGIQQGMTHAFNIYSEAAIVNDRNVQIPKSLIPESFPSGLHVISIPFAYHSNLEGSRHESFLKLCAMKGITFDRYNKTGTFLRHIDSSITGSVSLTTYASSRKKCLQLCIYALDIIMQQYGKSTHYDTLLVEAAHMVCIANSLKAMLRKEQQ